MQSRLRRLSIALVAGGGGAYAYYRYTKRNEEATTFRVPIKQRNQQGQIVTVAMELPYLDNAILEKRVKLFSRTLWSTTTGHESTKINFSGAQLNSNEPIEDMEPEAIVYSYENSERKPLIMAAVADGHSGPYTSAVLAHRLSALTIKTLLKHSGFQVPFSLLQDVNGVTRIPSTFKLDSKNAGELIKNAFEAMDYWLVWESPKALVHPEGKKEKPSNPDLPLGQILPAYSGACALATLIDTEAEEMWIACTGDCRAVAGYWEEKEDGTGAWRVDVLSEDQTAESPKEIARIIREHPDDNPANVIARGRVLGSLQPSRSFGDLRYKWNEETQNAVLPKILPPEMKVRPAPPNLLTPPYVTASPEITYRKFSLPSSTPAGSPRTTLRFLILATDGLWDELSSTDAVALVGGHLSGYRGSIPSAKLLKTVPTLEDHKTKTSSPLPHSATSTSKVKWSFREESLGMHLIRNAMGGEDQIAIKQLLSIPAPFSRRFRDDITVAVITFDNNAVTSDNGKIQAKL